MYHWHTYSTSSCCSPIVSTSPAASQLHRSASIAASQLRPFQLLSDCIRFGCCSPIASVSTALRLHPLLLLLPDCICFNRCSPIASTCSPSCSGRFQPMPNVLEHSSRSLRFKYEGRSSLVEFSPAPRTSHFRHLLSSHAAWERG